MLPKLVRDGIPAEIEARGAKCEYRLAAPEERLALLAAKVVEEANEVAGACTEADIKAGRLQEELADLLEVLRELALQASVGRMVNPTFLIDNIRREKRQKRGGFGLSVVLMSVTEPTHAAE